MTFADLLAAPPDDRPALWPRVLSDCRHVRQWREGDELPPDRLVVAVRLTDAAALQLLARIEGRGAPAPVLAADADAINLGKFIDYPVPVPAPSIPLAICWRAGQREASRAGTAFYHFAAIMCGLATWDAPGAAKK